MDGRPEEIGAVLASDCVRWWLTDAASDWIGVPRDDRALTGNPAASRRGAGCGRAPPGRLIRVFRKSARYAAGNSLARPGKPRRACDSTELLIRHVRWRRGCDFARGAALLGFAPSEHGCGEQRVSSSTDSQVWMRCRGPDVRWE